ncbi:hypothetical protein BASA83_013542 [Batrachochytrium salamandrivorans]|nr:hypothetical protein BASA83_013542 [Batrachochytrium salamandrivorans]
MDAELADRLNIPLVKIPVPIKLRLADGDSSSMITHRTLPLQLHIGRHVEQLVSMSLVSVMGLFLGTLGWRDTTHKFIGSPEWWILDPVIVWRVVVLDRLEFKVLESLQVPRISLPKPNIPEPESFDQTSNSAADPDINPSLFKDPSMDSRSGRQTTSTSGYQKRF